MKKIFALIAFLTFTCAATYAQRIAYVDSEYILKHIPEYSAAQKQLDNLSAQWQDEVDNQYANIETLYKSYQNDQSLLSADMRRRREDEIVNKEKQVKDFQKKKFGYEGELFQNRVKLIQPIQDRVSKAINDLATSLGLDLIIDKGSEVTFLYANPSLDKSNDVIKKLGYKPDNSFSNSTQKK